MIWTKDKIEKLIELYETNLSNDEIGKIIGTTKGAIDVKASKLKLIKKNKSDDSKRLTSEEIEYIKSMASDGISVPEIAKIAKRDKGLIYPILKKAGIPFESDFWWSDEDVEYLKMNYDLLSKEEIVFTLKKNWKAISKKARSLGILRKDKNGNTYKKSMPLNDVEISYILDNYTYLTYSELARNMKRGITIIKSFCLSNNIDAKRIRKNPCDFSDELLLSILVEESEKLGRCVTRNDVEKIKDIPDISIYYDRFGSFSNALFLSGLDNQKSFFGRITYSVDGEKYLSSGEKFISEFFIKNKIEYRKEVLYRDIFPNITVKKIRMDWLVEGFLVVEYFGLNGGKSVFEKYKDKTLEKIRICRENNVEIIPIFPNNLNEDFLYESFKRFIKF